jgi:hypothetical protein
MTLRKLLIQRAARLQERPALTTPDWGTLSYHQLRNRAEGIGLGLLATERPAESAVYSATGTPWDWTAELAAAGCGLRWDEQATSMDLTLFGGARFNDEQGRQRYHDREDEVHDTTRFWHSLTHAELLTRLQRMNRELGWDHETTLRLPLHQLNTPGLRGALWCVLYGGSHAVLEEKAETDSSRGWFGLKKKQDSVLWHSAPFESLWSESR